MKTKLYKIMAIAVTLSLLVSLLVITPAAAKDLKWSKESPPPAGEDGDYFWSTAIAGFDFFGMAIDGTIYAGVWVDEDDDTARDAGEDYLLKSTDEGRTWEETKYSGDAVVDIAFSPEDADSFWVTDGSAVYRTTNAGSKFVEITSDTDQVEEILDGSITSISVGYDGDDPLLFIGATCETTFVTDVYVLGASYGSVWAAMTAGVDFVYDVACSPNFADESDPLLMAVILDGTSTQVFFKYGGGAWNGAPMGAEEVVATAVTSAEIIFPEDFDADDSSGEMEFFVAVNDGTDTGGVYWFVTNNNISKVFAGADVDSIALAGEIGSATLMVGTVDGMIYYNDNYGGGAWDDANPAGDGNTYVLLAQDYLDSNMSWALVNGTDQSLTMSTDNRSYPSISLIDANWGEINDFAVNDDGLIFVAAWSEEYNDGLWRYDGDYWERVAVSNTGDADSIDMVAFSPDGGLFWADRDAPKIFRSTNDGDSFRKQNGAPDEWISSWLILDDSTVMVGYANGIQLTTNNGTTWKTQTGFSTAEVVSLAASPDYDADETILAGTGNGMIYMSTNGGKDWKSKKSTDFSGYLEGPATVAFDPGFADNGIFYAAGCDDWTTALVDINSDGDWTNIIEDTGSGLGPLASTGLTVSADGTLYATFNTIVGVLRCLNPTDPPADIEFEQIDDRYIDVDLFSLELTAGSNVLWGAECFGSTIYTYTDTLTGSPTLVSPSDGSSSDRVDSVKISWDAMDGAKEYEFMVGDDPGFKSWTDGEPSLEVTSYTVDGLDAGQTYYWKVRAVAPLLSRWSDTWEFTTDLGAAEWNPFVGGVPEAPANGATNVALQPSFAWNAADWATGYEFVLARDAAFSDTVVSKTGANALTTTVYLAEQDLDYSTTYYWKVRAVSKTSASEWATAVFTTEGEAPAAPTAPPTATPTPEATTPVYIWVIIGIGAALVIAVIILIVRTRRVA